jgi:DNA (cytosine-5)-methyltransferase 1
MSAIRQIGNAFPPLAARVLAEHLSVIDGRFGGDVSWRDQLGGLIGYRLTESVGMSPALARTDSILRSLLADQPALPLAQFMAEVA